MDDYHLERRANNLSSEVQTTIDAMIDHIEALEGIIEDYRDKISELEDNAEQLSNVLDETVYNLQQSELERLELVQLIKRFNNVDI